MGNLNCGFQARPCEGTFILRAVFWICEVCSVAGLNSCPEVFCHLKTVAVYLRSSDPLPCSFFFQRVFWLVWIDNCRKTENLRLQESEAVFYSKQQQTALPRLVYSQCFLWGGPFGRNLLFMQSQVRPRRKQNEPSGTVPSREATPPPLQCFLLRLYTECENMLICTDIVSMSSSPGQAHYCHSEEI